jgi:ubiquitin-like 1-activating enzyme E1 B
VFKIDILNLLSMSDMWRTRAPPTPLDYDTIIHDSSSSAPSLVTNGVMSVPVISKSINSASATRTQPSRKVKSTRSVSVPKAETNGIKRNSGRKGKEVEKNVNGAEKLQSNETANQSAGLKDQRRLSLKDNLELFVSR